MAANLSNTRRRPARQPRRRRHRASARRRFNGCRAAALRAFTAGQLYTEKRAPSLAAAAACCGSNISYVKAAAILIREPESVRKAVLEGRASLLKAAHEAQRRQKAELVTVQDMAAAWSVWTPAARAEFGRTVGVAEIWDHAIEPTIAAERGELAQVAA